jgi:hypothetical protein
MAIREKLTLHVKLSPFSKLSISVISVNDAEIKAKVLQLLQP